MSETFVCSCTKAKNELVSITQKQNVDIPTSAAGLGGVLLAHKKNYLIPSTPGISPKHQMSNPVWPKLKFAFGQIELAGGRGNFASAKIWQVMPLFKR
jgi:hypothetical protein